MIGQLYHIDIFYAFSLKNKTIYLLFFFKSSLLQIVNLGITGKIAAGHVRFQIMDINANSDVIARHTCAMLKADANNASIFHFAFLLFFLYWEFFFYKSAINITIKYQEIYFFNIKVTFWICSKTLINMKMTKIR